MSRILETSRLAAMVLLGAAGLAAAGFSSLTSAPSMARSITSIEAVAQDPYGQAEPEFIPFPQIPGDDGMPGTGYRKRAKAVRKKATTSEKSKTKKGDSTGKDKTDAKKGAGAAAGSGKLRFSKDIAPILVANCTGCHSGDGVGLKRGKLDLSTFEKLQAGTPDHKVVMPGNVDDSKLLLRIKGEEEPRMPQGANAKLSDAAIAKIERWVKEGAALDSGNDAKKPIASYAASADEVRKAETAKLPASERDKKTEEVGLQRFKQANPSVKPDVVPSEHFMMFSMLPKERAQSTLKALETEYGYLKRILGAGAMGWPEKVSIYAFSVRKDYIEFARTVEQRADVDAEDWISGRLSVAQPYVAVVDPQGGKKDEPGAGKRKARGRRGEERADGLADRSLQGLLAETLGSAVVTSAGNPPRWLAFGIGSYLASQVEPRSVHYRQLRQTAFDNYREGWPTRANEALGTSNQITPQALHSIAFAFVEAMMASEMRARFPNFVAGMLEGGEKLDDTLQKVYGGTREDFINSTRDWVEQRYGRLQ
jgi:cytochrome c553